MLKRKVYDELVSWKNSSKGTTAMMIDGARRVGKSYIAEEFAKAEYKSYILIDFGKAPTDILDLFVNDSSDLDLFFAKLSAFYSTRLHKRESLIIFDEVQSCPCLHDPTPVNENKDNSFCAIHPADKVLPAVHLAAQAAELPFHADLLTVCPRSFPKIRSAEGLLAVSQAHSSLSPLGRQRLRPRAIIFRKVYFYEFWV